MAPVSGATTERENTRGTIGLPRVPSGTQIQFSSPSNIVVRPIPTTPPRGAFGSISSREVGIAAAAVVGYLLLFRPQTQAASPTTTTPQTQEVPPAPTHLSEPSQLRQIGATSTTVIIATDPVAGAIRYDWYSYENNLILARSPSEVAVVNGLNPGTAYEIYVIAVGYGGAKSIPSSPLLVKTLPASPYVLLPTGYTTTVLPTTTPTTTTTVPTPTFPGLPTATGPSGVTTAPVVRPVQISPTPAATAVFRLVSAIIENMPVQPGQYAYANVTVQNIGDAPGGTSVGGNTWNPNGNLAGTWSSESTGVIPPGQTITITLRSSGLIASPYAIGTPAAPVSRLTATFTAASGGSVSTPLVIALPNQSVSTASGVTTTTTRQLRANPMSPTQPLARTNTPTRTLAQATSPTPRTASVVTQTGQVQKAVYPSAVPGTGYIRPSTQPIAVPGVKGFLPNQGTGVAQSSNPSLHVQAGETFHFTTAPSGQPAVVHNGIVAPVGSSLYNALVGNAA